MFSESVTDRTTARAHDQRLLEFPTHGSEFVNFLAREALVLSLIKTTPKVTARIKRKSFQVDEGQTRLRK